MSQARRLTGPKKYLAVVLAILFILLIWQVAAWSLPAFLMPGIPTVVERLITTIQQAEFREGLYGSMSRLGSGYGFALLFGIGFGLVGGVLFFFREILRSAIVILQSIPSIAWVPLWWASTLCLLNPSKAMHCRRLIRLCKTSLRLNLSCVA